MGVGVVCMEGDCDGLHNRYMYCRRRMLFVLVDGLRVELGEGGL